VTGQGLHKYAVPPVFLAQDVDIHSLQKTVAHYSAVVLSRYYTAEQLCTVDDMLQKLGKALLKYGSKKPLVKPFACESVQDQDMKTYYVKNPIKQLVMLLHRSRVFSDSGGCAPVSLPPNAARMATAGELPHCATSFYDKLMSEVTGTSYACVSAMLVPWTTEHAARFENKSRNGKTSLFGFSDRSHDKRLLQLLYAVRCFFHTEQRSFYAAQLGVTRIDNLTTSQLLELQIRFLWMLLQTISPVDTHREYGANDVMQIVAKPA